MRAAILRNEISADRGFTIEPSARSAKPSYRSLAEIDEDQGSLWLAKKIRADYGVDNVFPERLERAVVHESDHATIGGGGVCGTPARYKTGDWRQAYANYLVHSVKDYAGGRAPQVSRPDERADVAVPRKA